MKKSFPVIFVFLISTACGLAQDAEAPENAPPPTGKLIVSQMPDMAQWIIDSTYTNVPKPGEPSGLDRIKQAALKDPALAKAIEDPQYLFMLLNVRPVHVVVTKTGQIRHEVRDMEQGYKDETWANGDLVVERKPNLSTLVVSYMAGLAGNAFPEFDWISLSKYAGVQIHNKIKCLVFKEDRFIDGQPAGTAYAYVDEKTRYPVSYQYAVETSDYTILPAPSDQLSEPDDFAAAGKATMDHVARGTPHLGAP